MVRLGKVEIIKLEFRLKFQLRLNLEFGRQVEFRPASSSASICEATASSSETSSNEASY